MTASISRPTPLAMLGWAMFVLLLLYTVLLGGGWGGIYFVALRLLSLALITLGLAVWLLLAWRRPAWRPRSAIWPAFAAPLLALALATILSEHPRQGVEYLAWAVLLTALYLLLARILAMPTAQARIGGLAAGLGLGVGLIYLAVVIVAWAEWWSLIEGLSPPPLRPVYAGFTYGNPSAVLTVQVLLTVVAYAGLALGSRARQVILSVLTVLTLFVVVLSGSRAGWLALAGAATLVGVAWLLVGEHRGLVGSKLRERRFRQTLALLLGVGVLVGLVLLPGIIERTLGSGDGGRWSYFAAAWRMFTEDPITGQGAGMWAPLRATFTEAGETDYYITHAHNLYLHTLAETGLLGLAAGVIVVACLAWLLVRAIRAGDPVRRRWAWWATFALVYMALHDMLDYYANMPSVLVLLAIPVAYLDATSDRSIRLPLPSASARRAVSRAAAIGFAGLCLISVAGLARAELIAVDHDDAVVHIQAGDWDRVAPLADAALAQDPDVPAYQVTRALVAAEQADWQTAERLFGQAAAIDDLPQSWLGLALARLELGQPSAGVVQALEHALRLGVQQPAISYAAGTLYDRLGMVDQANAAYADALAAALSLAADPSWRSNPDLADRFSTILGLAVDVNPDAAWELALMAGDIAGARDAAGEDQEALRVIAAWAGDDAAMVELQDAARADPMDGDLLVWAARASAHAGDQEQAAAFRRLARFVTVGANIPGYDVRLGDRPSRIDPAAGTLTPNYGTYLYRRPTPADLMPGDLPRFIYDDPVDRAGSTSDAGTE